MSKRSAEILDSILKKIEDMPLEEKKKISDKLNTYIEELHNFDYNFSFISKSQISLFFLQKIRYNTRQSISKPLTL